MCKECNFTEYDEIIKVPGLRQEWEELVRSSTDPYAFYQSPAFWDYVQLSQEEGQRKLGVLRADDGTLRGIVPVRMNPFDLAFDIRSINLFHFTLRTFFIQGSEPLVPQDETTYVNLFRSVLGEFPECDCIRLQNVVEGGLMWQIASHSRALRRFANVYYPAALTHLRLIQLPDTFDDYMERFKARRRKEFRRELRRLREFGNGQLELIRIEHETDVDLFLEHAAPISRQSRQYRARGWHIKNDADTRRKIGLLANAGVFRSYLLRCGQEYCAFGLGFQHDRTFVYYQTGFVERYAGRSPGTVLLLLMIEDLIAHRKVDHFNLSSGDWWYKDRFATESRPERIVLLLRKNLKNDLKTALHSGFQSCVRMAKQLLRRPAPPGDEEDE
jgi:Acetyltransferase (GNAT) domain